MSGKVTRYIWPEDLGKYPEQALLIIRIIARWNLIEQEATALFTIFTRTNFDQALIILFHINSAKARFDVIKAAGKYYFKSSTAETLNKFESLFKDLDGRLAVRNKYAHAVYVSSENGLCIRKPRFAWPEEPQSLEVIHLKNLKDQLRLMGGNPAIASGISAIFSGIRYLKT